MGRLAALIFREEILMKVSEEKIQEPLRSLSRGGSCEQSYGSYGCIHVFGLKEMKTGFPMVFPIKLQGFPPKCPESIQGFSPTGG
jgi:hypothetical protein